MSIDWSDGKEEMHSGVRTLEQSIKLIDRATGVRPEASGALVTRLQALRRVSAWEQALAEAQTIVDVLDVSSLSVRASADCQRRYDRALAFVDKVLGEAPTDAHPRRLAEAVRRQVVAARGGRPVSPEVEDVLVDEPDTWPDE